MDLKAILEAKKKSQCATIPTLPEETPESLATRYGEFSAGMVAPLLALLIKWDLKFSDYRLLAEWLGGYQYIKPADRVQEKPVAERLYSYLLYQLTAKTASLEAFKLQEMMNHLAYHANSEQQYQIIKYLTGEDHE